jgi:hypothetical protein
MVTNGKDNDRPIEEMILESNTGRKGDHPQGIRAETFADSKDDHPQGIRAEKISNSNMGTNRECKCSEGCIDSNTE